ncbi:hypothetical protein [Microlunatus soli]|uniref:Uncharacterized protein n=1 Tax=Microlunatus soli TaxID=630515 RepID=A0A1H1VXN1_9ACTN|nr:hypothetical protein [Microlunatus soli]SDS89201.1 hypothetical protein SAMN04489812_3388 [Microlunatus soli]
MDGWVIGLIALLVIGIGVIAYGGLSDRRKHRRTVEQMLSPPPRTIPQFKGGSQHPHYLPAQVALRPPPGQERGPLPDSDRETVDRELKSRDTVTIDVGYASDAFVTDERSGRTVLDHPRILVSAEPIMSVREVISVIEHMITDGTPLVVAAPSMAPEVLQTLAVNHIQRKLDLVVLLSVDPVPMDQVVTATGANLVSRIDLQTGYLADADLGRCRRWVSDRRRSWMVPTQL